MTVLMATTCPYNTLHKLTRLEPGAGQSCHKAVQCPLSTARRQTANDRL